MPKAVKANVRAIRQILDQAGFSLTPDTASSIHHLPFTIYQLRPPQTIPTGFLRNDGRLDNNTASSACTSKALGH
jgi:hypothetical protein